LLVHENGVVKIPDEMPLDKAALLGCGVTTGLGAVMNRARVPAGATVAVVGCGGVGLSAVQGARISGARRIIAVDKSASRLELANSLGATDLVQASEGADPVGNVRELSDGGVDYSFEAVGSKATAQQAFAMLGVGGTCTLIGTLWGRSVEVPGMELELDRTVQGVMMGSNRFRIDIPTWIDLYLQGRLKLDELVTDHVPLERLDDALTAMRQHRGARTIVTF
jgi:S-(hydroxymethyl)glutathione dehydrogenase/alcohol dehydrogenase